MYVSAEGPVVAIAQKSGDKGFDPQLFLERFEPLAVELWKREVGTIGLNGKTHNLPDTPAFTEYYEFVPDTRSTTRVITRKPEEAIVVHAAYDRSGGIARFVPSVPALNPKGIRNLTASKADQRASLEALGDAVPQSRTTFATEGAVSAVFDELEVPKLIIKPDKDPDKKLPFMAGTKDQLARDLWKMLLVLSPERQLVVQEYMPEVHASFMPELRFHKGEREKAHAAADRARELRIHTIDETVVAAHGRFGLSRDERSGDKWVFFEQDSLPAAVSRLALSGARLLREKTGEQDSYLAWDITPDGSRIVEVNGRTIGTMLPHPRRQGAQEVHVRITEALADKLSSMAARTALHNTSTRI